MKILRLGRLAAIACYHEEPDTLVTRKKDQIEENCNENGRKQQERGGKNQLAISFSRQNVCGDRHGCFARGTYLHYDSKGRRKHAPRDKKAAYAFANTEQAWKSLKWSGQLPSFALR
jgi:hypothetical protein